MWVRQISVALPVVLACSFSLAACSGGGADVKTETRTTTTGQELLDLQKARDSGALTPQEYERQRKRILEQR